MKKLEKYSAGLFTRLLKLFSKYEQNADQETLHKIRITIKKIRSLFRLVSYCENTFNDRKHFRQLKKIFADAGLIRNMYIARKLIHEYDMNLTTEKIKADLDNEKRMEQISVFRKRIKGFQKNVYRKYFDIEKYVAKVNKQCLDKYIDIKNTELKNLVFPLLVEPKLHNARRICKEITFLYEINHNPNISIDPFFEKLQDIIGEWHDKIDLLKTIRNKGKDASDIYMEKLGIKIMSDLKSIKELVNDYYKTN